MINKSLKIEIMKSRNLFFLINGPIWIAIVLYTFSIGFYRYYNRNLDPLTPLAIKFGITNSFVIISWLLANFYLFYSYLVPQYFFNNRKPHFWILTIFHVLILGPTLISFIQYIAGLFLGIAVIFPFNFEMINLREFLLHWLYWLVLTFICGFLGFIFKLAFISFKNEQLKKELQIRNHLNEIRVMKAKLNPHFLFNTINNIDTLIQSRPTIASAALSKLSDILRYMVYETENELISIYTEIENLEKYIDLEKLRLINPGSVSFASTIKRDFAVPPLIFFPFVENSFKHSNLNAANQKLQISIREDNNSLIFECLNTINEKTQDSNFKGVGMELAKKRLDLLYPNRHKLSIKKENNEFHVSLKIDLNL